MNADWSRHYSPVDGLVLHSRRGPRGGPVVVLVHGLLVSSRYMEPLARRLFGEADVRAPDMPGFGLSDDPGEILDVRGLGDWLGRWLRAEDLTEALIVANSFGCQYAVDLAARDASRIGALVLAGPTMDPFHRGAIRQAVRWASNGIYERPSLVATVARDLVDCGIRRAAVTYRHALADRIEAKLPDVPVPTLVVRGERDPVVTQAWGERAAALLPRGDLRVIAGAGHTVNHNSPEALARIVRPLL